jgi:hypothetical protein
MQRFWGYKNKEWSAKHVDFMAIFPLWREA